MSDTVLSKKKFLNIEYLFDYLLKHKLKAQVT